MKLSHIKVIVRHIYSRRLFKGFDMTHNIF